MNSATYLCEEIVIEILRRLPVKSLVRFTAVCRLWKSIITGPQFIKLESSTKLLVHTDEECHAIVQGDEDQFFVLSETIDFPFKHWLRKAEVVGSDNGLVCIRIHDPNRGKIPSIVIFWNPSIRKHAVIPPMDPAVGEQHEDLFVDGFGATTSGSDYKYVRIVGFSVPVEYDEHADGVWWGIGKWAVEIYSWKTGTWRRVYLDPDLYSCKDFFSPTCASLLRGRLHWTGSDRRLSHINAFGLEDEVFEDIMLPECFSSTRPFRAVAFVTKESQLSVIANERQPADCCFTQTSVWVMQEYGDVNSWTQLCRVDTTAMIDVDRALHEFGGGVLYSWINIRMLLNSMVNLLKNGELLLGLEMMVGVERVHPPKLVKYNPKTGKATDIRGLSSSSQLRGFTNHYKESLVFLNQDDHHRVLADHEVLSGALPPLRRGRHEVLPGPGPSKRRVKRKLEHQY